MGRWYDICFQHTYHCTMKYHSREVQSKCIFYFTNGFHVVTYCDRLTTVRYRTHLCSYNSQNVWYQSDIFSLSSRFGRSRIAEFISSTVIGIVGVKSYSDFIICTIAFLTKYWTFSSAVISDMAKYGLNFISYLNHHFSFTITDSISLSSSHFTNSIIPESLLNNVWVCIYEVNGFQFWSFQFISWV